MTLTRIRIGCVAMMAMIVASLVPGQERPPKHKGIFSRLKVGQSVSIKDEGAAVSISYLDGAVPLAFKVTEVSENHIVVEDIAGVREMVVPVYAVKSVTRMKTKFK